MKHDFNVKKYKDATVYTLESATGGGTSAGAVASVSSPMGGVRKRGGNLIAQEEKKEAPKPRNFVAKNAKMGGAGAHKDKKKAAKQGDAKHKKPYAETLETLKNKLDAVKEAYGRYGRRDAYQRDYDSSIAGMSGSRDDKFGYDDAGFSLRPGHDEGEPVYNPRYDRTRQYHSQPSTLYFYKVGPGDEQEARAVGLNQSKRGSWYSKGSRNAAADKRFGPGREVHMKESGDVEEDAPLLAKAAGGLALGALGAAGAPAIVGLLGPILGTALAAYGAYNSAKGGMWAVDKLWDLAAKKLGGEDNVEQFAKSHMMAAAKGEDSFNYAGKEFPVKLKPNEVGSAAKEVKKLSENRKIKHDLLDSWSQKKSEDSNLSEDWQKVNKHDKTDGMSRKAVNAYRRENPGSKLKTAVTTKPSKLKKGGKAAKRRSSFCARMSGMKKAHASAKTKRDPDSPINKALRRWNCHEDAYMNSLAVKVAEKLNPQADVDVWVKDFQKADPNKYHQFKNKTPQKKAQMAVAAHYAANEPSKKK